MVKRVRVQSHELSIVDALCVELLFDHRLRRDPRMVRARDPKCVVPGHTVKPSHQILHGVVECMTHVQATGDVGWRDHDNEQWRARLFGIAHAPVLVPRRLECVGVEPALVNARLCHAEVEALGVLGHASVFPVLLGEIKGDQRRRGQRAPPS